MHKQKIKTVFLCGGAGKRMYPFTEDKVLLPFLGRTLLEHQIALAHSAGCRDIVIISHPGNFEQIRTIVNTIKDVKIELCVQENPGGIGDALQCARGLLISPLILVNPNDLFDISVYYQLMEARLADCEAVLTGYRVKEYFPGGYLVVDENGSLRDIVEKPEPGNEPSDLVTILVHRHNNIDLLMEHIDRQPLSRDDVYERAINQMVQSGSNIRTVVYNDNWTAIKYPWHILHAVRFFLGNAPGYISPNAHISEKATIEGNAIIADNVRVMENAVIRGPVYIGENTIIGNNCLIREFSHIGANCVIGFGSEIKGSYVGNGTNTHMNFIGDSVVGDNCNFGAGAVAANWRFDEQPVKVKTSEQDMDTGLVKLGAIIGNACKIGVNASLMPGVKIAPHTIVKPGTVIR